ncbi:septin, cell division protein Sep4a [Histoplasma capsulatum]|uniref:Septin, cell division protein Sep4a n=1 Tax=Ajellomyces capsulatus TaxID=5037 RepID=A0A8A1MDV7_AJECA|nr:septin, cell division protein Sep4a [Histoplasma capsulatum]
MSSPAPPTPGRSSPPDALPTATENGSANASSQTVRRTSLGFLRRSKSTEPLSGDRKASGGRMSKRMQKEMAKEELLRRQREAGAVAKYAPRLPDLPAPPQLKTFGGENARQMNTTAISNSGGSYIDPNAPASPYSGAAGGRGSEVIDPYARTESMTHRGRYSYASSAVSTINSPRRVRRRKDPTPYNILVIGARKSGKTSFLNFLRTSLQLPPKKRPTRAPDEFEEPVQMSAANNNFTSHYLETEIDGERVGLTLWDSQGLESNVVDLQLRGITSFLENNNGPIGRKFPWGFADPYNPEHCDFIKLKDTVFGEWRGELREASREVWYERWRTSRLNNNGNGPSGSSSKNGVRGGSGRSGRATR